MSGKTPFDYFDKIFCINLDSRPDRWEQVEKEFAKVGILERVERVSAYTPEQAREKYGVDVFEAVDPYGERLENIFACSVSHYECLLKAIESKAKNYLVFEDDIFFKELDLDYLNRCQSELPKTWGLFGLGWNTWNQKVREDFSPNLLKVSGFGLTHAYAINGVVFKQFSEGFRLNVLNEKLTPRAMANWLRIDYSMSAIINKNYVAKHRTMFQRNGFSDICGRVVERYAGKNKEN